MGGGLDQFYGMQNTPSQQQRLQMNPGARQAWTEQMRSVDPGLLGLSERGATPSGRSYFDPTRVAERELRIESKRQAAALSPFTSGYDLLGGGGGGGGSVASRMSRDAIGAAMRGGAAGADDPVSQWVQQQHLEEIKNAFHSPRTILGRQM